MRSRRELMRAAAEIPPTVLFGAIMGSRFSPGTIGNSYEVRRIEARSGRGRVEFGSIVIKTMHKHAHMYTCMYMVYVQTRVHTHAVILW